MDGSPAGRRQRGGGAGGRETGCLREGVWALRVEGLPARTPDAGRAPDPGGGVGGRRRWGDSEPGATASGPAQDGRAEDGEQLSEVRGRETRPWPGPVQVTGERW